MGEVLKVLSVLLTEHNKLPATKYHLMKYVNSFKASGKPIIHHYCNNCSAYLAMEKEGLRSFCNTENPHSDTCVFGEFPIDGIIKTFLENDKLHTHINSYKDARKKKSTDAVEDIFDGIKFKHVVTETLPVNDRTIAIHLIWNCDGIYIFNSSSIQLWPIQCIVLNVHPSLRRRYMFVCGLWNGKTCSLMNTFLKPMCNSLQKLASGFQWVHPQTSEVLTCCVFAPLASADAPARAKLQNIMQ